MKTIYDIDQQLIVMHSRRQGRTFREGNGTPDVTFFGADFPNEPSRSWVTIKLGCENLVRFPDVALEICATPHLADEDLEQWGRWYEESGILGLFGIRFLVFLQDPLVISNALAGMVPELISPPHSLGRRLTANERLKVAETIYAEKRRKAVG